MSAKNLAMAYAIARKNRTSKPTESHMTGGDKGVSLKPRMAKGGMVGRLGFPMMETELPDDQYSVNGIVNFADGGMADDDMDPMEGNTISFEKDMSEEEDQDQDPSISSMIRQKKMAKGGMAIDDNAIEHTNYMNQLNRELADHEIYSEKSALHEMDEAFEKAGSSDHDYDDIDHDKHDMASAIRRKYSASRR